VRKSALLAKTIPSAKFVLDREGKPQISALRSGRDEHTSKIKDQRLLEG
jgi:hypothetical protein